MKILLASIPATGHFNPILVAARILKEAGHETAIYTSVRFRDRIERAGVRFIPLPEDADQGVRDFIASLLEKHKVTPGLEEMVKGFTGAFINPMISQFQGLQANLKEFDAEVVIHEMGFAGVLPMLLGPRSERPASVYLGVMPLPLSAQRRAVGSGTAAERGPGKAKRICEIARNLEETKELPLRRTVDKMLADIGLPSLPTSLFASKLYSQI